MNRKNYEMSDGQLEVILDACKSVPVIGNAQVGNFGGTPQENANRAWKNLGEKMGFDHMTVKPTGQGDKFFSAVETKDAETES